MNESCNLKSAPTVHSIHSVPHRAPFVTFSIYILSSPSFTRQSGVSSSLLHMRQNTLNLIIEVEEMYEKHAEVSMIERKNMMLISAKT